MLSGSRQQSADNADMQQVSVPRLSDDGVFVPRSRALSYLRASAKRAVYDYDDLWDSGGGGERGLACECCVHMCSYDEMIEYCRQPHPRKRLSAAKQTDR